PVLSPMLFPERTHRRPRTVIPTVAIASTHPVSCTSSQSASVSKAGKAPAGENSHPANCQVVVPTSLVAGPAVQLVNEQPTALPQSWPVMVRPNPWPLVEQLASRWPSPSRTWVLAISNPAPVPFCAWQSETLVSAQVSKWKPVAHRAQNTRP